MTLDQKRFMVVSFLSIIVLVLPFWFFMSFGIQVYFNLTDSLPHKIFIANRKRAKPFQTALSQTKGYVVFTHPEFPGQNIIKKVEGVPGDKIELISEGLKIKGKVFPLQLTTKGGKSLTPNESITIPENHYFVAGTNFKSYDSRYEEFGLVHSSQIKEQVWPLF